MDTTYYINELEKTEEELSKLYSMAHSLLSEISNVKEHINMIEEQLNGE